jgi:nitroreductase
LPANCCGRKAQLDGKFSALCGFGIKPGYLSYNSPATEIRHGKRDPGVPGNDPAIQNMLLAARAFGLGATVTTPYLQFDKEVEAAFGLPPGVHSYALLPIEYPMGRFGPVRRVALAEPLGSDLLRPIATGNRACAVLIKAFSESRRIRAMNWFILTASLR